MSPHMHLGGITPTLRTFFMARITGERYLMAPAVSIFMDTTEFLSPTLMAMALTIFMFASLPGFPIAFSGTAGTARSKTLLSDPDLGFWKILRALFSRILKTAAVRM